MEPRTKSIFKLLDLPDHIMLLFELNNFTTLQDLVELDETRIKQVESTVGRLDGDLVDFSEPSERIKYLGFDYKDVSLFRFKPFDFRKLMRVSSAAKEETQHAAAMAAKYAQMAPKIEIDE